MRKGKTLITITLGAMVLMAFSSVSAGNWFKRTFGDKGVKGSGDIITEDRDVKDFTRIETSGSFDVIVEVGEKQNITLTFDDNLLDLIETRVKGKTLEIYTDESYRSEYTCKVEITVPKLEGVMTRGSGDFDVRNVNSDRFDCRTRGSGDITIGDLNSRIVRCDINGSGDITVRDMESDFLECSIHGSGDITAEGKVDELEINVSGSGDVDARDLTAREATIVVKGSGDVRVRAQESFDGAVYGSGDIAYYGKPEHISTHVAGSGSIKRR